MMRKIAWIKIVLLSVLLLPTAPVLAKAAIQPSVTTADTVAPGRTEKLFLNKDMPLQSNFTLTGQNPENKIEFTVRKDELVTQAALKLQFTPSPSLTPLLSQLKIYLNDELMGVISITAEQLGKYNQVSLPIDPRYINDFNRLKLQFIGHYQASCENPTNSTLWMDIGKSSVLDLSIQTLLLKNDLSHFPEPFVDPLDDGPLTLAVVFAGQPNLTQQRAAAILASWFGTKTQWRGQSFPVLFNQLPQRKAIVFATNKQQPDFLKNYHAVNAPTIEMIDHPNNPYIKLLLISGRDDEDLITAVKGIATGNLLFRGQSLTVDAVNTIAPRQPYDAPNWIQTDRPATFAELQQFTAQFQAAGFTPNPITLPFRLPPDLFLNDSQGITVILQYRYSLPPPSGSSRLNISLNNSFIRSYPLLATPAPERTGTTNKFTIPVLNMGSDNQMIFDFAYTNSMSSNTAEGHCNSLTLLDNHASIDGGSTIDFSNYYHYIAMPNLGAFVNSGFPFSRLADLSQTWVVLNKQPIAIEITSLLNTLGNIGAQTGYPALGVSLTDDWSTVKNKDTDILIIGTIPAELYDDSKMNLLLDKTQSWINKPFRQKELPDFPVQPDNAAVNSQAVVSSDGIMSAIIGVQSPFYPQRNIVALIADSPRGFALLNEALSNKNLLSTIAGTVTVIRESGLSNLQVGTVYYIGHLPWFVHIWHALQTHPINLAIAALLVAAFLTFIIWRGLTIISRRRLQRMDKQD